MIHVFIKVIGVLFALSAIFGVVALIYSALSGELTNAKVGAFLAVTGALGFGICKLLSKVHRRLQ